MQRGRNIKKSMSMRNYMSGRSNPSASQIVMTSGSTGKEVEKLQKMLVNISEDYTSIPVVDITSNYDDLTRKAVIEVQRVMGLDTTGSVNRLMWDRLSILSSNKTRSDTNEINQEVETSFDDSGNVISEGHSGKMVLDLQKYLNTVAEKYPSIPKLIIDGVFGPKTKMAVLEFQKLFSLKPDGIVGQITWETLYNISIGKKPPTVFD